MRTWWLVALCGCDSLFDLKVVPPPDGPPACYSSRQFGQICRTVTANDIEDTYLAAGKPTTPLGGRDALLVTATDPGLLKFDVSMIMPSERIADAQLVATPAGQADNCTNGTGSCPYCPIMVTQWQLAWVTTDWSSATATYDTRDGVTPWQDSDRGPIRPRRTRSRWKRRATRSWRKASRRRSAGSKTPRSGSR
jgi:hypothetical protein